MHELLLLLNLLAGSVARSVAGSIAGSIAVGLCVSVDDRLRLRGLHLLRSVGHVGKVVKSIDPFHRESEKRRVIGGGEGVWRLHVGIMYKKRACSCCD